MNKHIGNPEHKDENIKTALCYADSPVERTSAKRVLEQKLKVLSNKQCNVQILLDMLPNKMTLHQEQAVIDIINCYE